MSEVVNHLKMDDIFHVLEKVVNNATETHERDTHELFSSPNIPLTPLSLMSNPLFANSDEAALLFCTGVP